LRVGYQANRLIFNSLKPGVFASHFFCLFQQNLVFHHQTDTMPEYYLIIVILLFFLAASDLVVGVSNDAVNFLNSAIGSKAASFKTIMIIAAIGIFIGATFSSGMMEVARKGIFNPQFFQFSEVMVIFLAVMLTDIMLLDAFNTFGFPTSTTVSIVFELLGAAVVVAVLKIAQSEEGLSALPTYINTASALAIITGILSSVVIAFVAGAIIQYVSRLMFTFNYGRRMKWIGGIWSGAALTLITYFLIFKGIKGASFVPEAFINWVNAHTPVLLLGAFVFWSLFMQLLYTFFNVNILRIIVLAGTFSLAMAFAGNDLVNFIGVPIAGFESFKVWTASGQAAGALSMESLGQAVRTDTFLLLMAGIIMVLTLWFSKKARSVTETQVALSRQSEGVENFAPNMLARGIVRTMRNVGSVAQAFIPKSWLDKAESSFESNGDDEQAPADQPAFDLVRAAVNLTVASALIAFATSLKLPLSTTYVTFMVAMGASLADRAWGLDSAVYRVAGVLNVIGGWFITAIVAFTASGICAWVIYTFEMWGVAVLVALLVFLVFRSSVFHRRREKSRAELQSFEQEGASIAPALMVEDTSRKVAEMLHLVTKSYKEAITGLLNEDRSVIQTSVDDFAMLKERVDTLKKKMFKAIKRLEGPETGAGRLYLLVYDLEQDITQSTGFIVDACRTHIENSHKAVKKEQAENLRTVLEAVETYLNNVAKRMEEADFENVEDLREQKKTIFNLLETQLSDQIQGIKQNGYGRRNSMLMFSIKLETKDIVAVSHRFVKLYHRLQSNRVEKEVMLVSSQE
jgi:phosphate/sulfate permease